MMVSLILVQGCFHSVKPTSRLKVACVGDNFTMGIDQKILENEVIPIIKKVAHKFDAKMIDVHADLSNHPELFYYKVHPTIEGSRVIAESIYKGFKSWW